MLLYYKVYKIYFLNNKFPKFRSHYKFDLIVD